MKENRFWILAVAFILFPTTCGAQVKSKMYEENDHINTFIEGNIRTSNTPNWHELQNHDPPKSTPIQWEPVENSLKNQGFLSQETSSAIVWKVVENNYASIPQEQFNWIPIGREVIPHEIQLLEKARKPVKRPVPDLLALNRSITYGNYRVGPDIGFLVPQGFKWTPFIQYDSTIRGWSKRQKNEDFLAFNNGDAVGQFYYQPIHGKNWSLGASLGIRSIVSNPNGISESKPGEGLSAGFRFDYSLSNTAGIAIGAEQLVHFDDKTDTGRDIYLVASKGFWLGGESGDFPLGVGTVGVGTGYLGRNPNLQFACNNYIDAGIAQVDNEEFYPLCWNPIASAAVVINPYWSLFTEYNGFAFVAGSSISPFKKIPLRATWGVTLAQDFSGGADDYAFESDRTRWFFRLSMGF